MTTHALPDSLADALRADIAGRVVLLGDADWDDARRSWNTAVDQHPAAVVEAASVADVQATVRHARAAGLRVAPQTTGHGSETLALDALRGAILLKTSRLNAIAIDPAARTATVGAGAQAGAVADAAGEHELAPVLGLATTVGVAGLSLGGGLGWLSRAYGLAANNVTAIDVVTASGEALRVDAEHEPDLFWALRGGGGRFAIVTGLEVRLHAIGEVTAGMVAWPAECLGEVLEQARCWAVDAPECASAVVRLLSLPPIEEIPEPIRGKRIVAIIAAQLGPAADAQRVLAPLRGTGSALMDTFGPVGPADLVRVAGDPEAPGPARGDGLLLERLTPELVETVAALAEEEAVQALTVMELRQLGGALGRPAAEGHGVRSSIDAGWAFFAGGAAPDEKAAAAVQAALATVRTRLAPFAAKQTLLSLSSAGIDPATAFDSQTWSALGQVRDRYDPDRLILAGHDDA